MKGYRNPYNAGDRYFRSPIFKQPVALGIVASEIKMVSCHGCGVLLAAEGGAVRIRIGMTWEEIRPRLCAPWICAACREDSIKLTAAREEMERHFAGFHDGQKKEEAA